MTSFLQVSERLNSFICMNKVIVIDYNSFLLLGFHMASESTHELFAVSFFAVKIETQQITLL